jgi:hypothetical protein
MSLDELSGYPCPYVDGPTKMCKADCLAATGDFETDCQVVGIYRRHIALRRAVLGNIRAEDMVSAGVRLLAKEYMVQMYRRQADMFNPISPLRDHFNALADEVEEMC